MEGTDKVAIKGCFGLATDIKKGVNGERSPITIMLLGVCERVM